MGLQGPDVLWLLDLPGEDRTLRKGSEMDERSEGKDVPFDIKERTFQFGVRIVRLVGKLPRTVAGTEVARQLIRAGTGVGSNVEEAGEGLSRPDFLNHLKIARKEAKESGYWLAVVQAADLLRDPELAPLGQEAKELVRILTSIIKGPNP